VQPGLTAYVQSINSSYQAFSKTGTALMGSLSLGNLNSSGSTDGDPIVLYDKYADRWFIQEFQQSGNSILIAISKTNDPTGAYYEYTFVPDASTFPDYPKFSIWPDGYYMTCNYQPTQKVTVFDRTKMLAGNAAAGMIVLPAPVIPNPGFFAPMPADADGVLPPAGTPCYMFAFEDDNQGCTPASVKDQIHIFKMTTNWTTPASSSIVEDAAGGSPLAVTLFNSSFNNYGSEVSQKGSTQALDVIQGIFMYRAQFRKWTGYNTVVLNNAVNVNTSTNQSGIRWYELRQTGTAWSIHQQGTYAPDAENRWMGSIAMDDNGSIGMAYAVAGPGEYPSLRYTGRYSSDPLGTMPFAEVTAKAGVSACPHNRWGDYGQTSLDPSDGMTFWHTGMWEGAGGTDQTQVFSFKITPSVATGTADLTNSTAEYKAFLTGPGTLYVKANNLAANDEVVVDLFDIDGRQISGQKITPASNMFETNISVAGLAKGTYLVRIGNLNFQKVIKVPIN
jgi:hypothetical protein